MEEAKAECDTLNMNTLELIDKGSIQPYFMIDDYYAILNDKIIVKYNADTGSDDLLINMRMAVDSELEIQKLSTPRSVELAIQDSDIPKNEIEHYVVIPKLVLKTEAGPLIISNVMAYVIDGEMNEILLGKRLLKTLGIDIDKQLSATARRQLMNQQDELKSKKIIINDFDNDGDDPNSHEKLREAFEKQLQNAKKAGLPDQYVVKMRKILLSYKDIFRFRLGKEGPAAVKPYNIELKDDKKYYRSTPRRYNQMQSAFLEWKFNQMVKHGFAYEMKGARSTSPALVQNKISAPVDITTDFRLTGDFRRINDNTVPLNFPMINMDSVSPMLVGRKHFQKFDFVDFFTQLPATRRTAELLSIMTDKRIFAFGRVQQGTTNAAPFAQMVVTDIFRDRLMEAIIAYIDDLLNHAKTYDDLVENMIYVFDKCRAFNMKLHPAKMILYADEISYLGCTFNGEGVKPDENRIQALIDMPPPENAGELQSWLAAANWIRSSIPDFSRIAYPLTQRLQKELAGTKRTNRIAKGIAISLTNSELECYEHMKKHIAKAALLTHYTDEHDVVLMTDASDVGYGAALFTIERYDPTLPIKEQGIKPIAFISGIFANNQRRWAIVEKEAYSIVYSIEKWQHYLLRSKPIYILTDHLNLKYIFNPSYTTKITTTQRLQRWQISLMSIRYVIHHVSGEDNVMADALSRWGIPTYREMSVKRMTTRAVTSAASTDSTSLEERDGSAEARQSSILNATEAATTSRDIVQISGTTQEGETDEGQEMRPTTGDDNTSDRPSSTQVRNKRPKDKKKKFVKVPLNPFKSVAEFAMPNIDQILKSQEQYAKVEEHDGGFKITTKMDGTDGWELRMDLATRNGCIRRNDAYWIPEHDDDLIKRLLITAHCGIEGHKGIGSTSKKLKRYVNWRGMDKDIRNFITSCLLCCQVKDGNIVHRPYGETQSATKPNEVIHFDFLYMMEGINGECWLLVIRDELSGYIELFPTAFATAEFTADALMSWISRNGYPDKMVSDNGTHFNAKVMTDLAENYKILHHFTTPLIHFSNGTVERVNRDILATVRILLLEYQIAHREWTRVITIVQHTTNHAPSDILGGYTPVEVYTGRQASDQLEKVFLGRNKGFRSAEHDTEEYWKSISTLRESLREMHLDIRNNRKQRHLQNLKSQTRARPIDFGVGTYVLLSRRDHTNTQGKLYVRWTGPYLVVGTISEQVYEIQHLITGKLYKSHSTRLKFYTDTQLNMTEELKNNIESQGMLFEIDGVKSFRWNDQKGECEVEIQWKGFEEEENSYERFESLWTDVPLLLTNGMLELKKRQPSLFSKVYAKYKAMMLETAKRKKFLKLERLEE